MRGGQHQGRPASSEVAPRGVPPRGRGIHRRSLTACVVRRVVGFSPLGQDTRFHFGASLCSTAWRNVLGRCCDLGHFLGRGSLDTDVSIFPKDRVTVESARLLGCCRIRDCQITHVPRVHRGAAYDMVVVIVRGRISCEHVLRSGARARHGRREALDCGTCCPRKNYLGL